MHLSRRIAAAAATALVALAAAVAAPQATPVRAQQVPTVSFAPWSYRVFRVTQCDGDVERFYDRIEIPVEATGLTDGQTVEVGIAFTGDPVRNFDGGPAPTSVVLERAGGRTYVQLDAGADIQQVTATLSAGAGYQLGTPSTIDVSPVEEPVSEGCGAVARRAIRVGETPEPADLRGLLIDPPLAYELEIDGEVPPGLTYDGTGTFVGAATTPGRYEFVAGFCRGPCVARQPFVVDVLSDDVDLPVTPTDPGTPPAAVPVAGRPQLTG